MTSSSSSVCGTPNATIPTTLSLGIGVAHNCGAFRPEYMKSQSFRLALQSYRESGLLELARERLLFLNNADQACRALGTAFGF